MAGKNKVAKPLRNNSPVVPVPFCIDCSYCGRIPTTGGPVCNKPLGASIDPVYGLVGQYEAARYARAEHGHCGPNGRHYKRKWWKFWV